MIKLGSLKTAEEAIVAAGMNFAVEQTPIMGCNGMDIKSHKLLFRSDDNQPLGVVGSGYVPIQNSHAFSFMDVLAEKHGATYEYGAVIKGGRRILIQARLGNPFDVRPGDKVEQFVTLVNSHDGSTSLRAFFTPIRLFCMNQLSIALAKATSAINLRHTANIEFRIRDALQVFNLSGEYFAVFKQKAAYLSQKIVDTAMVNRFLDEVMKDTGSTKNENQRQDVVRLFENGKGNGRGTAWDLWNGMTEFIDHERGSNPDKRLESSMFGQGSHLKQASFEAAMEL